MSVPGGKKGGPKAALKKGSDDAGDRTPAASKSDDAKDETSSNGDKKEIKGTEDAPAKPQSAGATQRDGSLKLLNLAMKSEWTPIDQVLKILEKAVAAGGEDTNTTPMAGIMDPVSKKSSATNNKSFFPPKKNCLLLEK